MEIIRAASHHLKRLLGHERTFRDSDAHHERCVVHAYFANVGGVHLKGDEFPAFPMDSHQLVYLVEHNHIEYTETKAKAIWDRDKADTLARILSSSSSYDSWFRPSASGCSISHSQTSSSRVWH